MTARAKESLARQLLRSAAQFSAGQMIAMFASIARVAISARFLSKEANGLWLGMQLILSYGAMLHFGSVFGVFRSIPLLRAQGSFDEAERERRTSFVFTAIVSLLSSPVLYWITLRTVPAAEPRQVLGTVVLVALSLFRSYYNAVFKAESRFRELASAMTLGAVLSLAATGLVIRWGLTGLIVATGTQALVETAYLAIHSPAPAFSLSPKILRGQIRVGFVTLLTSLGLLLLTTIDRTVMIQRLGSEATGAYYIGANIMVLMPVIVGMPAAVLTPQFFERVGRGEPVLPLVERPIRLAGLAFAALIAVGVATVGPTISLLWPKLVLGSAAAQAALFATYPLVLAGLVSNVYYAHDRQGLHVAILIGSAAVSFGLAQLGVSLTHDITGAAVGAAAGLYLYFPASAVGSFYVLGDPRAGLRLALRAMLPMLYAGTVAIATERALHQLFPASATVRGTLGGVIVGALAFPLLARARRALREGMGA